MKNRKMKGAIIESVIAVAIIVTSSIIVINMITPAIEESKTYQYVNKAKETMSFLDSVIRELAVEAPGARRTINLVSDFGTFAVTGKDDSLKFTIEGGPAILDPGTSVKEGNLLVTSGPTMSAYESDVNSDGVTDLVLENDAVLLAIRKIGSPTNITSINTTSIFTMIRNKKQNVNITPITYIYMDDNLNNAVGDGFTELTVLGSNLLSGGIRVYVNSSGTKEYDAIFTLSSAQDFIELEIRNIKEK